MNINNNFKGARISGLVDIRGKELKKKATPEARLFVFPEKFYCTAVPPLGALLREAALQDDCQLFCKRLELEMHFRSRWCPPKNHLARKSFRDNLWAGFLKMLRNK